MREIFERFAASETQRAIASDLNHRRVPSPGATWKRRERTADGKWRVSAIHAMLRNERYLGRIIWNRSRWVRSAADSKRRKRVENPRSEWIIREGAAIIDESMWSRVKARQDTGYPSPRAYPRYLLSGLLECGVCGRKMTISGGRGHRYICGNRHSGVGCKYDLVVSRVLAEELILQPVTEELLSEEAVTRAVKAMQGMQPAPKPDRRLAELKRLVAEGVLSQEEAAPAMDRLRPAETPGPYPAAGAADAYREVVRTLRDSLEAEDIAAARPLLRDLIGPITAVPTESDGERYLTAHFPAFSAEARLVAGARYQRYLALVTTLNIASGRASSCALRAGLGCEVLA